MQKIYYFNKHLVVKRCEFIETTIHQMTVIHTHCDVTYHCHVNQRLSIEYAIVDSTTYAKTKIRTSATKEHSKAMGILLLLMYVHAAV